MISLNHLFLNLKRFKFFILSTKRQTIEHTTKMSYPNYPQGQPAYPGQPYANQQYPNPQYNPSYGVGSPTYSPEDGQGIDFDNAFSDKKVRQGFIRKVYSILSIQLLISFGSVLLFTHNDDLRMFAKQNAWIVLLAFVVSLCTLCPMICVQSLRRQTPHNYILLIFFTLAESVVLGYLGAATKPEIVRLAVFLTAGIVIGLTLFAFQTKWDFTALNGIMFVVLLCFSLSGLVLMFFRTPIINLVYSSIGALIFSIYIVIDTQSIVGGSNRKYQVSSEEYIFASLILYLDIVNLFTYILSILNEANK